MPNKECVMIGYNCKKTIAMVLPNPRRYPVSNIPHKIL